MSVLASTATRIRLAVAFTLLALVLTFVVQNAAIVEIRLFAWKFEISRVLLIFITLAAGFIIGWSTRSLRSLVRHAD